MLGVEVEVTPVEGVVVTMVAGQVELGAADELPPLVRLGRLELETKN